MKKIFKRTIAVFLLLVFVIGCAPVASAEESSDEAWEAIDICGTHFAEPYDYIPLDMSDVIKGAKYFEAYSSDDSVVRIDDPSSLDAYAAGEGVAVITIYQYDKKHNYLGTETHFAIVSESRCDGIITSNYAYDTTVNYKSFATMDEPEVYIEDGDVEYWNYYIPVYGDIYVSCDGTIDTSNVGSGTIVCVSIATNGSASAAFCNVTVKYSFAQWLIRIFLFGFLWY